MVRANKVALFVHRKGLLTGQKSSSWKEITTRLTALIDCHCRIKLPFKVMSGHRQRGAVKSIKGPSCGRRSSSGPSQPQPTGQLEILRGSWRAGRHSIVPAEHKSRRRMAGQGCGAIRAGNRRMSDRYTSGSDAYH